MTRCTLRTPVYRNVLVPIHYNYTIYKFNIIYIENVYAYLLEMHTHNNIKRYVLNILSALLCVHIYAMQCNANANERE